MTTNALSNPLTLPCGAILPNRVAKAAMTEGLAGPDGAPNEAHVKLYRAWAGGGAGLSLTGNVQVDAMHLERPGNVVIDREPDVATLEKFKAWAKAGTENGTQLWMQISHAGRQTQTLINPHPKAPSAIALGVPGGQFGVPVPLTENEIEDLIGRFALAASVAKRTGFNGIQIHAAHGYLISQFLNPRANQRQDQWGGSLENRARFLLRIVKASRAAVGPAFAISVKLNSADFQQGGFTFDESVQVAKWLEQAGVDLIEVSGGSYEQPKMMNMEGLEASAPQTVAASTAAREAYFVDFAKVMRKELKLPLMLTGGIRTRAAALHALETGAADLVGLGRPMCTDAGAPRQLISGDGNLVRWENKLHLLPGWASFLTRIPMIRAIDGFGVMYWYYEQLHRWGRGEEPDPMLSAFKAFRAVDTRHRTLAKAAQAMLRAT